MRISECKDLDKFANAFDSAICNPKLKKGRDYG
jgi:hypothetical protein